MNGTLGTQPLSCGELVLFLEIILYRVHNSTKGTFRLKDLSSFRVSFIKASTVYAFLGKIGLVKDKFLHFCSVMRFFGFVLF